MKFDKGNMAKPMLSWNEKMTIEQKKIKNQKKRLREEIKQKLTFDDKRKILDKELSLKMALTEQNRKQIYDQKNMIKKQKEKHREDQIQKIKKLRREED